MNIFKYMNGRKIIIDWKNIVRKVGRRNDRKRKED